MAVISYLTQMNLDFGAVNDLGQELERLGIERPLLVTDRGVVAAGILDRVRSGLSNRQTASVFDGTPANPTETAALLAQEQYRADGCDGLVAIGGGSSMDLAKAVALLATHDGNLTEYMAVEGGAPRITDRIAPVVAIPTTAGTGSEVGRGAVIILEDGRKLALLSPHLLPKLAICDPELTFDLPPLLTAGTGMDAVAHCVETYLSNAINPVADAIALDGLTRALGHLERAVADGRDREARWNMMVAASEGAMAFQKGLGAVHALSHPLGALPDRLHHGTLNAVLLPAVLRFNAPSVGSKMDKLAEMFGVSGSDAVPGAVAELNRRIGLPSGLAKMGVSTDVFPEIVQGALGDHTHATNPRLASAADYQMMLEDSL